MREKTQQEEIRELCNDIKREIGHWKYIRENGCSDPFWPDGCNMNLTRNHIIYDKRRIAEICQELNIELPEEYYIGTPPEVPNNYMASRKNSKRMQRIKDMGYDVSFRTPKYDADQMSFL